MADATAKFIITLDAKPLCEAAARARTYLKAINRRIRKMNKLHQKLVKAQKRLEASRGCRS